MLPATVKLMKLGLMNNTVINTIISIYWVRLACHISYILHLFCDISIHYIPGYLYSLCCVPAMPSSKEATE